MVALSVHGDGATGMLSSLSTGLSVAASVMVISYDAQRPVDRADSRAVKSR